MDATDYYIVNTSDGVQYTIPVEVDICESQSMNLVNFSAMTHESENDTDTLAFIAGNNITETAEWSDSGVKLLIETYKEKKQLVENRKIKTLKQMWKIISNYQAEYRYAYISQQCENEWNSLERAFMKKMQNKSKTGRGKRNCSYERELGDILYQRASIVPPLVLKAKSAKEKSDVLEELMLENPQTDAPRSPASENIESEEHISTPSSSGHSVPTNTLPKCHAETKSRFATIRELTKFKRSNRKKNSDKTSCC